MINDAPIAIVGAGPVGLSAALRLASLGIECVLLEAELTQPYDLRASTFHPPTLEMLDSLGLTEKLIARGLITPHWQIRIHETGERAVFDLSALAIDGVEFACKFKRLGIVIGGEATNPQAHVG